MFSNFVTFTEVIKLSTNVYHRLQDEIYDDKLFEEVCKKKDVRNYTIFDLVDGKKLTNCISYLREPPVDDHYCSRWLKMIMKFILKGRKIDVAAFNNLLITCSHNFGLANFVEILVEKGADVSVILHESFLIDSSAAGHLEMIKFLVQKNLDVNFESGFALNIAIYQGHLEVVRYLVEEADADVNLIRDISILGCKRHKCYKEIEDIISNQNI